jgi:hypothetical protein
LQQAPPQIEGFPVTFSPQKPTGFSMCAIIPGGRMWITGEKPQIASQRVLIVLGGQSHSFNMFQPQISPNCCCVKCMAARCCFPSICERSERSWGVVTSSASCTAATHGGIVV